MNTEREWKRGDRVICNGNPQGVVQRPYGDGMYEVLLMDGCRYVGEVCVDGRELKPAENPK